MIPTSFISDYSSSRTFTRRQADILQMVVHGCTNPEIASELNLKEQVVKNYLKGMFDKAGIKNRVSLVVDVYDKFLESKEYLKFMEAKPQFDLWMSHRAMVRRGMDLI